MIGKKIGTQGTARILLRALLAKHKIKESDVQVVVIGQRHGAALDGPGRCGYRLASRTRAP